jgi:hypothetical protein
MVPHGFSGFKNASAQQRPGEGGPGGTGAVLRNASCVSLPYPDFVALAAICWSLSFHFTDFTNLATCQPN